MSRRNRRKVRGVIQGRKLKGHGQVNSMGKGLFSYQGHIFDIEDFPQRATINLDKTWVLPIAALPDEARKAKKKRGKKRKKWPKNENAMLYSNKGDCLDVQLLSP